MGINFRLRERVQGVGINDSKRRFAELIATGLGSGYFPVAPATAGSALALLIYWVLPFPGAGDSPAFFLMIAGTLVAGTVAAAVIIAPSRRSSGVEARQGEQGRSGAAGRSKDESDPKRCVIDEFVGVWATCLFLPTTWAWLLAAFLMFRALDILKPFGIRRLEKLPGAYGIMADDLAAGLLGAGVLNAVRLFFFS